MLEIGNGGMSAEEYRAHMSLWAMQAAPLIAGNDLRTMSEETKSILTNSEVIAVDQDSLGAQGTLVQSGPPDRQVWSKPLRDGSRAVVLLNRTTSSDSISVSFRRAGLHTDSATVRDLWRHAELGGFRRSYTAIVPGHAALMLRITGR
jgi:alpha-galactosidase